MRVEQIRIQASRGLASEELDQLARIEPSLLLLFASPVFFKTGTLMQQLRRHLPDTHLVGCSSAGEIAQGGIELDSAVITAIHFERTRIGISSVRIPGMVHSRDAGWSLGRNLARQEPACVLLLSKGIDVSATAFLEGLRQGLPGKVPVFGGMAGDNLRFERTWLVADDLIADDVAVAVSFIGDALEVNTGSSGGWHPVGPIKTVTAACDNIILTLDDQPALDTYLKYLGDALQALPDSRMRFPLSVISPGERDGDIRGVLAFNEINGALIMSGDIQEGSRVQVVQASTDSLVDGAETAAALAMPVDTKAQLALLVSCVGRRMVMGTRVEEEVDVVHHTLGANTPILGFYSYGEFSTSRTTQRVRLLNHTMTIACLSERPTPPPA